jgi:hypothetical protein
MIFELGQETVLPVTLLLAGKIQVLEDRIDLFQGLGELGFRDEK